LPLPLVLRGSTVPDPSGLETTSTCPVTRSRPGLGVCTPQMAPTLASTRQAADLTPRDGSSRAFWSALSGLSSTGTPTSSHAPSMMLAPCAGERQRTGIRQSSSARHEIGGGIRQSELPTMMIAMALDSTSLATTSDTRPTSTRSHRITAIRPLMCLWLDMRHWPASEDLHATVQSGGPCPGELPMLNEACCVPRRVRRLGNARGGNQSEVTTASPLIESSPAPLHIPPDPTRQGGRLVANRPHPCALNLQCPPPLSSFSILSLAHASAAASTFWRPTIAADPSKCGKRFKARVHRPCCSSGAGMASGGCQ
jgi:hypothetical protein